MLLVGLLAVLPTQAVLHVFSTWQQYALQKAVSKLGSALSAQYW